MALNVKRNVFNGRPAYATVLRPMSKEIMMFGAWCSLIQEDGDDLAGHAREHSGGDVVRADCGRLDELGVALEMAFSLTWHKSPSNRVT